MANSDKIVTAYDYLDMWYYKTGYDPLFNPPAFPLDKFYNYLGVWRDLDSLDRCLWHGSYPLHSFTPDVIHMFPNVENRSDKFSITKEMGPDNKLITIDELSDFTLQQITLSNCVVKLPSSVNGNFRIYIDFINNSWVDMGDGNNMRIYTPTMYTEYGPGETTTLPEITSSYYYFTDGTVSSPTMGIITIVCTSTTQCAISGATSSTLSNNSIEFNEGTVNFSIPQIDILETPDNKVISTIIGTFPTPNEFKDYYSTIHSIDVSKIPFHNWNTDVPVPDEPDTTISFAWTNYSIPTGSDINGGGIYLGAYQNILEPYEKVGDFLSLDGLSCLATVNFSTGSTNGNKTINFSEKALESVYGRNCYFRTAFYVRNSFAFYLYFRVVVYSDHIYLYDSDRYGCGIWFNDETGTKPEVSVYVSSTGGVQLSPPSNISTNMPFIYAEDLVNYFSNAYIYTYDYDTISIQYDSAVMNTTESETSRGECVSFISPLCTNIDTLVTWINNSNRPSVKISGYY